MTQRFDILVIGAGPAGLATALSAAEAGRRVGVIDDQPAAGGQIWRGAEQTGRDTHALRWLKAVREHPAITVLAGARVIAPLGAAALLVESEAAAFEVGYDRLILATGARERFLPFPGWTLPGVFGAGGLQALAKGGLPVKGKRIVVAGSGPLLLAVAAHLAGKGAHVVRIAEQAPPARLLPFGLALAQAPAKLRQALQFGWALKGAAFRPDSWVAAAHGAERLQAVTLQERGRPRSLDCDYLACGFGLVPNTELPAALGCAATPAGVTVDEWQRTSQPRIYAAGETTGIGGVELSLVEGRIAGLAAADQDIAAQQLFREHAGHRQFARLLEFTFALRPELLALAQPDTIVCRCEDVSYSALAAHASWRSAKLQTRCGMGPCQGRVCGGATALLFGWSQDSIRPPLTAARIGSLALTAAIEETTA